MVFFANALHDKYLNNRKMFMVILKKSSDFNGGMVVGRSNHDVIAIDRLIKATNDNVISTKS
jgi:hypothetical protein